MNNFSCFPASSRAVLVQITPVLGVLVGVVVTLILIAVCIVIFVKIKNKVSLPFLSTPRTLLPNVNKDVADVFLVSVGSIDPLPIIFFFFSSAPPQSV